MKKGASVVFSVLLLGGMMASGVMNGAQMASDYNDWVNDTVAVDSIFEDTAMDVSSDISVLNTLLAQEGLTDDALSKLKKQEKRL